MVQLKFSQSILPQNMRYADFNSIVVQLKPIFHNQCHKAFWNFNSIVVQLKHLAICLTFLPQSYLNSMMVQLKPKWQVASIPIHSNFNSIMVQLKQILMICRDCLIQFQFHNGTIKTFVPSAMAVAMVISIP